MYLFFDASMDIARYPTDIFDWNDFFFFNLKYLISTDIG